MRSNFPHFIIFYLEEDYKCFCDMKKNVCRSLENLNGLAETKKNLNTNIKKIKNMDEKTCLKKSTKWH